MGLNCNARAQGLFTLPPTAVMEDKSGLRSTFAEGSQPEHSGWKPHNPGRRHLSCIRIYKASVNWKLEELSVKSDTRVEQPDEH
jgi:hypothetical protein